MKSFLLLTVAIVSVACAQGQQDTTQSRVQRATGNLTKAVSESVNWFDLPIAFIRSNPEKFRPEASDGFKLPPFNFEANLQQDIGRTGRTSPGSIDPRLLPDVIFVSRLLYNIGEDLATEKGATAREYKHDVVFLKSLIYADVITEFVKNWTLRDRPDKSDSRSFFSGHTSMTFTAAAYLFREINDDLTAEDTGNDRPTRAVLRVASFTALYGWAGYVGWSRMRDNKHYLTDIVAAATVGILLGNAMYDAYIVNGTRSGVRVGLGFLDQNPAVTFVYEF